MGPVLIAVIATLMGAAGMATVTAMVAAMALADETAVHTTIAEAAVGATLMIAGAVANVTTIPIVEVAVDRATQDAVSVDLGVPTMTMAPTT